MTKAAIIMACAVMLTLLGGGMTSFAGEWKTDAKGWWYAKDGGYAVSEWVEDGGKWYYIGGDGYMLSNAWIGNYYVGTDGAMLVNTTTPDGYRVGADGAWIQDGGTQDTGYLEKYAELLRGLANSGPARFKLVYVDEDSRPELIAISGLGRVEVHLYTYYQGNAEELAGDFGYRASEIFYVEKGNLFYTTQWFNGGEVKNGFYSIKDGESVSVKMFSEHPKYYTGEGEQIYLINDQEVPKSTYDSQLNEMINGYSFKEVNYNTAHEVNEANIQKMLSDMNSSI